MPVCQPSTWCCPLCFAAPSAVSTEGVFVAVRKMWTRACLAFVQTYSKSRVKSVVFLGSLIWYLRDLRWTGWNVSSVTLAPNSDPLICMREERRAGSILENSPGLVARVP